MVHRREIRIEGTEEGDIEKNIRGEEGEKKDA